MATASYTLTASTRATRERRDIRGGPLTMVSRFSWGTCTGAAARAALTAADSCCFASLRSQVGGEFQWTVIHGVPPRPRTRPHILSVTTGEFLPLGAFQSELYYRSSGRLVRPGCTSDASSNPMSVSGSIGLGQVMIEAGGA